MTGKRASSGKMPRFNRPGRLFRDHDEPALDMMLGGQSPPPDAPPDLHDLAERLQCLSGPAELGDMAGETKVLAMYASAVPPATISPARPAAAGRRKWTIQRTGLSVGLATLAIALAGTAAAYADVLPGPVQDFAHRVIDAPAPRHVVPAGRSGHSVQPGASPHGSPSPQPNGNGKLNGKGKHRGLAKHHRHVKARGRGKAKGRGKVKGQSKHHPNPKA